MTGEITLSNGKSLSIDKLGLKATKGVSEVLKGIKTQPHVDKVLIVLLDLSDSMLETFDAGNRKVDALWKVLKDDLSPKLAGWTYGILSFQGSETTWIVYPTSATTALVSLRRPGTYGSTPMKKALETAWVWVKQNADSARFILVSDGCPTDCWKDELLEVVKVNTSIPIDTVGIGKGEGGWSEYDESLLRGISRLTGGVFVRVGSMVKLVDTIATLSPTNRPLLGMVNKEAIGNGQ